MRLEPFCLFSLMRAYASVDVRIFALIRYVVCYLILRFMVQKIDDYSDKLVDFAQLTAVWMCL